jgi:hypothetical protein
MRSPDQNGGDDRYSSGSDRQQHRISIKWLKQDLKTAVSAPKSNNDPRGTLVSEWLRLLLLCEHHQYEESIMAKGQQRKNKEAKKPKKKPTPAI